MTIHRLFLVVHAVFLFTHCSHTSRIVERFLVETISCFGKLALAQRSNVFILKPYAYVSVHGIVTSQSYRTLEAGKVYKRYQKSHNPKRGTSEAKANFYEKGEEK